MKKDLLDWFKAYLIVSFVVVPVIFWLTLPLSVLIEGEITRFDFGISVLSAMVIAFSMYVVTSLVVVIKTIHHKLFKRK